MDNKYKQGKIYKLICTETLDKYIGSTIRTLKQRLKGHRQKNNECESKYFVNPIIELIEDYPCNNRRELEKREQYYIDNNECVNKRKSYTTKEDSIKKHKEYRKKWREDNKEKERETLKKYYLDNKERHNQWTKNYYLDNKEKINEKFNCECGGKYIYRHEARHKKTKKHKEYKKNLDNI